MVATPAILAKVAIPEKSENVAKPALLASVANIEVDIVPVVNPVIITSLPIKVGPLMFTVPSTIKSSKEDSPSTSIF